ncbi:MAG: iron-sulfur cluster assembly accessory protein, partial [Candidatus Omnitrophota bacterium]|nr:iron-sulfur cluster assembly accessory protein [Candidatus Omnitrophota bacterium]
TPKAAEKAKELMTKEGKNFLRIAVKGGGCSGMEYHLELEDEKTDFDEEIEVSGIKIIIDKISAKL